MTNPSAIASLHARAERAFDAWGCWVCAHPWLAIAAMTLLCVCLGAQLRHLQVDGSADAFLHEEDPVRVAQDTYRAQFGRDNVIAVAIEGDEIFSFGFLEKLRAFHSELEDEVPQLQEITSFWNARHTYGLEDELVVGELMEDWPESESDLLLLREQVAANALYHNYLISADGRASIVILELDTYSSLGEVDPLLVDVDAESAANSDVDRPRFLSGEESYAIVRQLDEIIARHDAPGFEIHMAGGPVMDTTLMVAMQEDIALFIALAIGTMTLLLFVLFRHWAGVVLPLAVVLLGLICTLGTMAASGVAITLPIQVLPSLLLAVGVGDAVHILTIFFRRYRLGVERHDAIRAALAHSGLAVVMTSLTTAGGLGSFAAAELAPVMHFGIFGPIGVGFALLLSVVLLPALLAVIPLAPVAPTRPVAGTALLDRALAASARLATTKPGWVLGVATCLLLIAVAGASRLRFSHDPMEWLPEDTRVRIATEYLDQALQGSMNFEVQLETGRENGFHDPELLQRLDELLIDTAGLEEGEIRVGKVISILDILKEIHQALNANRSDFYSVPDDRVLVAQELLLFENSGTDDLEDFVDSTFATAGLSIRIPWVDAVHLAPFVDSLETRFEEALGELADVTVTGGAAVSSRTFSAVILSMANSYAMALLIVTPLMMLLLGNLRAGLLSMVPNLAPILLTLGLMGWLDFSLDFSTMMIGAIILGVAVDDTIHFMHGFRRYRTLGSPPAEAVALTIENTGLALLFTSIVLSLGFFVYVFATMGNLINLGLFTSFAVATAFLADVLLAPALLMLFGEKSATQAPGHVSQEGP